VRTIFGQGWRGSLNADVHTYGAKKLGFLKMYGVSALCTDKRRCRASADILPQNCQASASTRNV